MTDVDEKRLTAYGWACDALAERWHISKSKGHALSSLITDAKGDLDGGLSFAPAGEAVDVGLGYLCRAYKVMLSDLLTDRMVEALIEQLDEVAGESVGIDDSLYRYPGKNAWNSYIAASRERIGATLDDLWKPTLWYHEVQLVAPVRARVGSLSGGLAPMPGELVKSADPREGHRILKQWHVYSHVEPVSADKVLLATEDKAYIEIDRKKPLLIVAIGEWSRFGKEPA